MLKNGPGPRLEFGGTCSSVLANRTYLTIVQPLVRCELMVKTKSTQAEAVEIQFNNRFDEDALAGGDDTPALDWPPVPSASQ